jgi:hypothetical protein
MDVGEKSGLIAAALAGWLLLAPPMETGWIRQIDASAPVSRWHLITSFNSAASCSNAREARITRALNSLDRAQKILRRERRRRLLLWAYLWECLPSDDPGLSRVDSGSTSSRPSTLRTHGRLIATRRPPSTSELAKCPARNAWQSDWRW